MPVGAAVAPAAKGPPPAADDAIAGRFTVQVAPPGAPSGIGAEGPATLPSPAELTPDQRRQRARRLSRSPIARQRVANADGSFSFVVRNLLHAPMTLRFEPYDAIRATVQMLSPPRVTLAPLAQLEVARVYGRDALAPGEANFVYTAVIGDPAAVHDDRVVYAWPFPPGTAARLTQGRGGPTHRDRFSFDAVDLAVPEGTPVLAARAGVVVFLEERYFESGLDLSRFLARSNQVRILHDDGSMATYAHLFPDSIDVEPGQRVQAGERIGLSGNTGFSSGPHLHFAVVVHRDMGLDSVPFRMQGLDGGAGPSDEPARQ